MTKRLKYVSIAILLMLCIAKLITKGAVSMAKFIAFSNISEIPNRNEKVTVITTDTTSSMNPIPSGINIDEYCCGKKINSEYYDTVSPSDEILDAKLNEKVYIHKDAIQIYETVVELAETFKACNGCYEVYAEKLEEMLEEENDRLLFPE